MPIRINLLAEAQAAEDVRRRDPVKRAVLFAALFILIVMVWVGYLQAQIFVSSSKLTGLDQTVNNRTNKYSEIVVKENKLHDVQARIAALNKYAAERYLNANTLDAIQHSVTSGIQVTRVHVEQNYEIVPEVKAGTNPETGRPTAAKPGNVTEKIRLVLDARDASDSPGGEQINKFKQNLAATRYFQCQEIGTNKIRLRGPISEPQVDPISNRAFVTFSLECVYDDRAR